MLYKLNKIVIMKKKEISNRVLQNGNPLSLDKFTWCEETRTFSTNESNLVLDFNCVSNVIFKTGNYCIFKTSSYCTFKTSSYCTFDTSSECTFITGSRCIFDTGYNSTFDTGSNCIFKTNSECTFNTGSECVIIRRDRFEVIQPQENELIQILPYNINGFISKREGETEYHMDIEGERIPHILSDGILSKIISKKGDVYKVINHNETEESFLIKKGDLFSHGKTIKEAKESLIYKISNRDTSQYDGLTLDSELTFEESVKLYRVITGSCEHGVKQFVKNNLKEVKEKYLIKEIITLTESSYGNSSLVEFFKK